MTDTPTAYNRLPSLLVRNRNFILLWAAYGISAVGDHLSEMALLVERDALEGERSVRIQALLTFGFFLPFVLLGPLAGWWADRFSRKWTMIAADLVRAAIMASLFWIVPVLTGWLEPRGLADYAVALPLFVVGAFAALFSPCRQAILPTLIREDQLVRANALINALGTIGTILSAVLGGYLVKHAGTFWNYKLDALTFVLSAALLTMIAMQLARPVPRAALAGVWRPVADGFRYVRQHRRVLQLILLGTVFWASAGVVISIVPALVRDVFGGDIADAGLYRGLIGIGLALGAALMTIIGNTMRPKLAVLLALAGGAFWILALDAAYSFKLGRVFSGLCLMMIGAHGAALLVTILASIQRFVPDSRRGRVFGVADMATMGAMVATTGALGLPEIPGLDRWVPLLLGAAGLAWIVTLVVAWRVCRRGDPLSVAARLVLETIRFHALFWCRLRREGPCTVPASGPVIIAANHTTGIDPMLVLASSPHRLPGFIVAKEYYDRRIAGWFMRLNDCVPVDRASPTKSFLASALTLLKKGGCLAIFPQGRFQVPGQGEDEAQTGVALLALRTGATVVPCHISGTRYYDNVAAAYFVRHNARVKYGAPIDLSSYKGRSRDKAVQQEVSDLIMRRINELAQRDAEK